MPIKTDAGVNQALILYGRDEYRLYEAALTIEKEIEDWVSALKNC